jgi:hypothetical protein
MYSFKENVEVEPVAKTEDSPVRPRAVKSSDQF